MSIELISPSYLVFTSIGILGSCFQATLSFYILYVYLFKNKSYNSKMEYQLIFFRVLLDALNGVCSVTYYSSSIPILLFSLPFDFVIFTGLIGENFMEMRGFLAAIIAIERALAATFPLAFYKWRNRISNIPIFIFLLATAILVEVVLFGFCDFRFPVPTGCNNVVCAVPSSYYAYAVATKQIYSSTNALFSAILCYKLLKKSNSKNMSRDFRKANWLSLTDGLSTLLFEMLPMLIFNSGLISFKNQGPVLGSFRQVSRAVEAVVMVMLMKKEAVVDARASVVVY